MKQTSNLKLDKYDTTDAADLTKGHNTAMDQLERMFGMMAPPYVLSSDSAALPAGAKTPCLIVVPGNPPKLWYEDGKAASDEEQPDTGPAPYDEGGTDEPTTDEGANEHERHSR